MKGKEGSMRNYREKEEKKKKDGEVRMGWHEGEWREC